MISSNSYIFDIDAHWKEELRKQEIHMKYKGTQHGELARFIDNYYQYITIEYDINKMILCIETRDFGIVHHFPPLNEFGYGDHTDSNGNNIYFFIGTSVYNLFIDVLKELNSPAFNNIMITSF